MRFETIEDGTSVIMQVTGALMFADNKEWRRMAEAALDMPAEKHIIDLTMLESIDSAGLGMMLMMRTWADNRNRKLSLRIDTASTSGSMIRLAKFDDLIENLEPLA